MIFAIKSVFGEPKNLGQSSFINKIHHRCCDRPGCVVLQINSNANSIPHPWPFCFAFLVHSKMGRRIHCRKNADFVEIFQ